jgi:hypothetical protein
LDAFLSAVCSVPELIRCCFGIDENSKMKAWLKALGRKERERRREFGAKFKADYDKFCASPLGTARHISEHRTGFAPVEVKDSCDALRLIAGLGLVQQRHGMSVLAGRDLATIHPV